MKIRNNTLNVWDNVRKKGGGPSSISRAMPIAGNTDFRPSLYDGSFKGWVYSGLVTINQLMEVDHLTFFCTATAMFWAVFERPV